MKRSPEQSGFRIIGLKEAGSTNSCLKQLCREREVEEFTVLTVENQTAGRGQRGNCWESEPGKNLTFSLLVRPVFLEAREQFLISQIISLSIKEELDRFGEGFTVKWPNDIYWNDLKICGILIENNLSGTVISESIIGACVNLNQHCFSSPAPNPVSLAGITGREHSRGEFLNNILVRFADYYRELRDGNRRQITAAYDRSLYRRCGFHAYEDSNGRFRAAITGVNPDGVLVLRDTEGVSRRYAFKEVAFVSDFSGTEKEIPGNVQ